jgi:hypothetical protein
MSTYTVAAELVAYVERNESVNTVPGETAPALGTTRMPDSGFGQPSVAPLTEAVTLTIDMTPDRRLAPNRNNGRMRWTTGEWIKADREMALRLAEVQAMRAPGRLWTSPVCVTITIYWGKGRGTDGKVRQARRLDWDSATALVKPMIDGALVDSGILADDRLIVAGTVLQAVSETGEGYTVIEIVCADQNAPIG